MKHIFAACLITIALSLSCDDPINIDPETGFEVFYISPGEHNSLNRSEAFTGIGMRATVIFDESAIYTTSATNNQGDINKLIGFSDCAQHHQSESARFGWRWYQNELQILAYVYREGVRTFELMGSIALDTEVDLAIDIEADHYRFSGNGLQSVSMARTGDCEAGENYWLWPYFGGDEPAPHQVKILIKREVIE